MPQPKLNSGTWLDGLASRRTVAAGTLPFFVQALTIHCADWPGLMLTWERCRLTHRLVGDVAAYMASSTAGVSLGDVGAGAGSVPSPDGVADAAADELEVAVGVAVAVAVAVALADGVLGDADADAGGGVDELDVAGEVGADDEVEGVVVGVPLAGGVGVDVVDTFSGWHCEITGLSLTLPPEALLISPLAMVAARLAGASAVQTRIPVVVARITPPAMRLSETGRTGRTRAKHMEDPARNLGCLVYLAGLPRLAQPLTLDDSPPLGGSDAISGRS